MGKKKILVASTFFYPHMGGVETYSRELFTRLKEKYPELDITLIALNTDNAPEQEMLGGVAVYRIPSVLWPSVNPFFSSRALNKVLKDIDTARFDLVITQCRYYFLTNSVSAAARRYGVPLLHIEHNGGYMKHKNPLVEFLAWLYDRLVSPSILRRAGKVVCISEGVRSFIGSAFGIVGSHIRVITSGIDADRWMNVRHEPAQDRFPVLFYGGRFIKPKGIYILLECVQRLVSDYPILHLFVAGSGPDEKNIRKQIHSRGLETNVTLLGRLSHEEMQNVFQAVDIYANPSFYSEGLQVSLLEAACAGLPIVSTDVGGAREVLVDGESGLIVLQKNSRAFEKALRRMIDDKDLRERLGSEARRSVRKRFSWDTIVEQFYDFAIR